MSQEGFSRHPKCAELLQKTLVAAIEANDIGLVKGLIALDVPVNFRIETENPGWDPQHGMTPLMVACFKGPDAIDVVKLLLSAGANVHARHPEGQTALILAVNGCNKFSNHEKDATALIDTLIDYGADPHYTMPNGFNALLATFNNYDGTVAASAVGALLKYNVDLNSSCPNGSFSEQLKYLVDGKKPSGIAVQKIIEQKTEGSTPKASPNFTTSSKPPARKM